MIPIYEQGDGRGIGHGIDSFCERFDAIWRQHREDRRARAFAFIFYDFTDAAIREILVDQGVFAQLDRLAGDRLSVFYLHAGTSHAVERFNEQFLSALEVAETAQLPCVVFFRFDNGRVQDVHVVQLESPSSTHGFHELYGVIERYTDALAETSAVTGRALKWLKGGAKFIGIELFRAALRRGLDGY